MIPSARLAATQPADPSAPTRVRAGTWAAMAVSGLFACGLAGAHAADGTEPVADVAPPVRTTAEVLANTNAAEWRRPDPAHTLYVELASGRVVIELAPAFAPAHVANIQALARAGFYDQAMVTRSQENYVVQWGLPEEAGEGSRGEAREALPAEFDRTAAGLDFTVLEGGDVYADQVGWSGGFPAARDITLGRGWLAHCNAMVGAGRGNEADSSDGSQLYVVIGHAPRHLDRNITTVGRVIHGMEHLSVLPRGTGPLGFYEDPAQRVALQRVRLASEVPEAERTALEVLRTESDSFAALVQARRHRHEEWFIDPVGRVELCNVPIPVRPVGG